MLEGFFIPFITIALAELFDKSQLAILLLASRTNKQKELFLGVFLAFAILSGIATLAGGFLTSLFPQHYIKIASSVIFIVFGILTLRKGIEEKEEAVKKGNIFLTGFTFIFLSELGDKTQLATIVFATRFSPILVFLGSLSALAILSVATIKLGSLFNKPKRKRLISKIAGILFIAVGIVFYFA